MERTIAVQRLLHTDVELGLVVLAGAEGLARSIAAPRIQKPGLALTGWPEQLHEGRVLIIGGTEVDYMASQTDEARAKGIGTLLASSPACVVVCRGLAPPSQLESACEAAGVPLLVSGLATADFIARVTWWMQDEMAAQSAIHGVLVDVLGLGVLLLGKSGIGKSETALDLVMRGHRLVADDVVSIRQKGNVVLGAGAPLIRHHMEIRGIGIINIKDLFGVNAVRENKKIELVVELVEWDDQETYERLGVDVTYMELLSVPIPSLRLPVRPGRNMASIIEVAARNQLLKLGHHDSAKIFHDKLRHAMHVVSGEHVDIDAAE